MNSSLCSSMEYMLALEIYNGSWPIYPEWYSSYLSYWTQVSRPPSSIIHTFPRSHLVDKIMKFKSTLGFTYFWIPVSLLSCSSSLLLKSQALPGTNSHLLGHGFVTTPSNSVAVQSHTLTHFTYWTIIVLDIPLLNESAFGVDLLACVNCSM